MEGLRLMLLRLGMRRALLLLVVAGALLISLLGSSWLSPGRGPAGFLPPQGRSTGSR